MTMPVWKVRLFGGAADGLSETCQAASHEHLPKALTRANAEYVLVYCHPEHLFALYAAEGRTAEWVLASMEG